MSGQVNNWVDGWGDRRMNEWLADREENGQESMNV